jgi:hypothetical protein
MRVPDCACTPTERLYDTFEDLDRRTFVAHYPTLSTYPKYQRHRKQQTNKRRSAAVRYIKTEFSPQKTFEYRAPYIQQDPGTSTHSCEDFIDTALLSPRVGEYPV